MENKTPDYTYDNVIQLDDTDTSRKFIANVFLWMFIALAISAACTYIFAFNPELSAILRDPTTGGNTTMGTIVMFSPFAFVLIMSFGVNKISFPALTVLFLAFAAMMGMSLSVIFLAYPVTTVAGVFITTSVVFGVMAVAGYTTHTDLTKFGSLMIMLLFGIVIASLVNWFLHSDGLGLIISYVGVAVFTGLTAYDVQKLKRIGAGLEYGSADSKKVALMGALTLYLDFINLFLMLLRVFGRRR